MIAKAIGGTSTASLTLDYLHHDKGGAITAERVTWAENVNCIQASAEGTERMWAQLVDDAPEIKRQAGGSTRGRRLENPYAHYVTSWSPDENPSRDEMMTATKDAMDRLGYKGCQYRVVAHSDTDHKHAHAIVCRVHPETGRAMGRKKRRLPPPGMGPRVREGPRAGSGSPADWTPTRTEPGTCARRGSSPTRSHRGPPTPRRHGAGSGATEGSGPETQSADPSTSPIASARSGPHCSRAGPTPSEKADLKKAQTERRIIKAERSERAVPPTPKTMEMAARADATPRARPRRP